MELFKIKVSGNTDQVVKALADFITAVGVFAPVFRQFNLATLLGAVLATVPTVQQWIVNGFSGFLAQFADLDTEESAAIVTELRNRFPSPDPAQSAVINFLDLTAQTHDFGVDTIVSGELLVNKWRAFIDNPTK